MTESIINDQESRETNNNFPKWIDAISSPVIIVTDEGKVRYSNFHCREHLEVNSGDTVLMNRYRDKLVGIRKTAQNENPDLWIKVSSFFQIDYEGEKANMLLVEASQKEHTEIHSTKKLIVEPLLSNLPGVLYQCENDIDRNMLYLSEGCFELTGYPADVFTGNEEVAFAGLIHPDDFLRSWEEIQTAVSENRPYKLIFRIRHADGSYRWVQEQGKAIFDHKGKIAYLEGWIINITGQKRLEQALQENESYYRNLLEASPDAVVLLDYSGEILFANQQLAVMLDVGDCSLLKGKNLLAFLVPEDREKAEIRMIQNVEIEEAHQSCYNFQSLNGRRFPAEISIRSIQGEVPGQDKHIMIVRDVSYREEILSELKIREAQYRAIVEDNPEMIARFSREGLLTFANQAFCNFFQIDIENYYGKKLLNIVSDDLKKVVLDSSALSNPGIADHLYEQLIERANTSPRWIRWKTLPIHNEDQFIEYQTIGEDVTDQKKVEQANIQAELSLRNLMQSIKLLAITLDMNGRLSFCNNHFLKVTGWQEDEIVGKDWLELFVPEETASQIRKIIIEGSQTGRIPYRYENALITKSGEQRQIAWNNTVLFDDHGKLSAIASIGEDITDKYYYEKTRDVILKISQATISDKDLNDLFTSIHFALKDLMSAENFFIALYDEQTDLITFPYFVDQYDAPPEPHKPGRGLTDYVLRTKEPLLLKPEEISHLLEEKTIEDMGSPSVDWMGVPLLLGEKAIGVMGIQSYSDNIRYHERDEQMFTFISTQVAMAIERKRAEQALISSQKRNELLVQASTDAIFLEKPNGSIIDCNQITESMYGYTKEELLTMNVSELVDKKYIADKPEYVKWQLDHGGHFTDIINVRKDGSTFPVEISTQVADIEGDAFVVAYIRNISERKKAENAILESESLFRGLTQSTAAGIYIHRGDSFLYVNPSWSEMTGYSNTELMDLSLWEILAPGQMDFAKQKYVELIQNNQQMIRYETSIITKRGEKKWLDITSGSIEYLGKQATIGTAIDISYRKQREHELEIVAQISDSLRSTVQKDEIGRAILKELMELLEIEGALISTSGKQSHKKHKLAIGCWELLNQKESASQENLTGFIEKSGKSYINHHAALDPNFVSFGLVKNLTSLAGVPLIAQGNTVGALVVGAAHELSENELSLFKTIGDLAASALHRAELFNQTKIQAEELKKAYDATLEGWAYALELRDKETQGHSLRIAELTQRLARRMGFSDEDLENIRRGALLHDIGKMGVPDTILLKPGRLTEEEWNIMQKHPAYAYEMLSDLAYLKDSLDIPYCHHEWWDGSGYPRGLKGTEIPLSARIFAIVDSWDALVSDRPYRKAWVKRTALKHIIDQAGTHFDSDVVNHFVQMMQDEI